LSPSGTKGAEKSAPARARKKTPRPEGREAEALAVNIRQFGTVAPCLALDAILNPTLGFTAISEAAESDSFAREPINDNRDPLIALVNERYFTPIQHKQPLQK
jgi:hypothetical protein